MKYQRLKSIDGSGTIMRYYKFTGDEAYTNAFYGVTDGVAEKIVGTVGDGVQIIGFSHGGNNLAKGLILLDINPAIVYAAFLGEGEDRPDIGDVVNGYQKVIDTHYDGDNGVYGKNDDLFGVERLDAPYYLFTIVQPEGTEYASEVDDDDAGEISGTNFPVNNTPKDTKKTVVFAINKTFGNFTDTTGVTEVGDLYHKFIEYEEGDTLGDHADEIAITAAEGYTWSSWYIDSITDGTAVDADDEIVYGHAYYGKSTED